jgi:rubredoxin
MVKIENEVMILETQAYYCPNCRSNRTKFSFITSQSQDIMKNAITGEVETTTEPSEIALAEPQVRCRVCDFVGNELRFVKQAERNPRTASQIPSAYK